MGVARDERRLLTELFSEVGPDAPTLCDPWRTRDLAAHLVLRERRLDAAAGILVKPLAGHTQRVQDAYAAKPWDELVDLVRQGQGVLSIVALGGVKDELDAAITELRPPRESPSATHPSMGSVAGAMGGGG